MHCQKQMYSHLLFATFRQCIECNIVVISGFAFLASGGPSVSIVYGFIIPHALPHSPGEMFLCTDTASKNINEKGEYRLDEGHETAYRFSERNFKLLKYCLTAAFLFIHVEVICSLENFHILWSSTVVDTDLFSIGPIRIIRRASWREGRLYTQRNK